MGRLNKVWLLALCMATSLTHAEIVIGQSAPLTGLAATYSRHLSNGAKAYFNWLNKQGGINGEQVKFVVYDDGNEFPRVLANTTKLINQDKAVALMGYFSADGTASVISRRWLDGASIPLVGVTSSTRSVREPGSKFVFHTRAGQREEVAKLISQMKRLGINKIGVFYQDDQFGQDGLAAAEAEAKSAGVSIAARASYPANTVKVDTAAKRIADSNVPAVLMISITKPTGAFIKALRAQGSGASLYQTSTVDFEELVKDVGAKAVHGLAIAQVYPYVFDDQNKLIKEFRTVLASHAPEATPAGYAALEGYITAKLVSDAIAKAGKGATRAKVYAMLESMSDADIGGGYRVSYSGTDRSGSKFVDLTIVNQRGELSR
ncbi:ABC transporter substrate-binding protein [Chitinimonas sp. BJYL2]|uniref:ABC transporter substrate-binding protein n=1 Tax=Chitinimonas sp. BJYL2 TaxID=2976696 RepID=UPI0022B525A5|nr:ABC transporter substrate-binding protein [Chitinimonas sp. BJYL2]